MQNSSADTAFSHPTTDIELVETRPIRWSGIAAFLLGIASLAMLATPTLLPIPVAALALGLFAQRPSGTGSGRPIGQRVAVCGMALAALFGGWSVAGQITRERQLKATSVEFAQSWLDLISQGEIELAFELTQPPRRRQLPMTPLKAYYAQSFEQEDHPWNHFQQSELVYRIAETGQPQWELAEAPAYSERFDIDYVSLTMRDASGSVPSQVELVLTREVDAKSGVAEWVVEDFELLTPKSLNENLGFAG